SSDLLCPNDFHISTGIFFSCIYQSQNMIIEDIKFLSWNPKFLVNFRTHNLSRIPLYELGVNIEFRDISGLAIASIPSLSNESRVFNIANRIEDRLLRQSWRKTLASTFSYELEFFFSHGSV